jgi:hypothetical protein
MRFSLVGSPQGANATYVRSRTKDIKVYAAIKSRKDNRRINT